MKRAQAGDRFAPPEVQTLTITRPRVALVLDLAVKQRLTLIVAPPGYGKTVLLSEWAAAHSARRIRWITLGPEHDDLATFTRDLRDALGVGSLALDAGAGLRIPTEPHGRRSALRAELDAIPPTTVVLEDLHVLQNPDVIAGIALLVEHAPRALHVIISTRVDPAIPYHHLGLSGLLVELRQEDLAFTSEEAAELIRRLSGRTLLADQVDALVARTEGWAVGLQLAALSLRVAPDVDEFVRSFAGDDRRVVDYLTEQVLRQQPEDVQDFLLSTSVLDRMCGPLCDHVTQRRGGQAMLEQLDRQSMFITKLDARHEWFRYHPLFRALLRHHARDRDAEVERQLVLRAAEWHLARDEADAAVRYLSDAEAWDAIIDVAASHGRAMLATGRAATVASWIELVPPHVRTPRRVDLMLLEAGALAFGGEVGRAGDLLDAIDELDAVDPMPRSHRVVADLLRAHWALHSDDPAAALEAAKRTIAGVGDLDVPLPDVLGLTSTAADISSAAHVIQGSALVYLGRLDEARAALETDPDLGDGLWQVAALGAQALLEAWSGNLTTADRLGRRALSVAGQLGMDDEPALADAHLALVVVAVERNDFRRAHELIEAAARRSGGDRRALPALLLSTEQALLALAEGEPDVGLMIMAERGVGKLPSVPKYILARRSAVEAQLLLAEGDLEGAVRALDRASRDTSEVMAGRVRIALERGDVASARELLDRWPSEPQPRAGLERELWRAVVEHVDGDEKGASQRVADVVSTAEIDHDVGLFRGHLPLGPVRALYRSTPTPFLRAVIDQPVATPRIRPVTDLVEQLTQREYMVLVLLPSRLSNAEIAEQLGISLNTTKTHLKHIYRKFAVAERSEAVAAAERLGLL